MDTEAHPNDDIPPEPPAPTGESPTATEEWTPPPSSNDGIATALLLLVVVVVVMLILTILETVKHALG